MTSERMVSRAALAAAVVALSVGLVTRTLSAQAVDSRFQPWMGCWTPLGQPSNTGAGQTPKAPSLACVVPSQSIRGSVDIVVFDSANVSTRAAVPLPGTKVAKSIDGCSGTETANWTPDNVRLVLSADLACGRGGARRSESGLLTMTPAGEWMQVQHLNVGGNSATTVLTMRYVADSLGEWARLGAGAVPSTHSLRLAAGAPIANSDVLAVAKLAPAPLVEAWITETGQRFALNGKELIRLADAGMPPRVIDLMIAMSNPQTFAVRTAGGDTRQPVAGDVISGNILSGPIGNARARNGCRTLDDFCYGPGGMGAWGLGWQYGMNPYDPWSLRYGVGGLYNSYGYGYGNRYGGGYYYGNNPIIIVDRGGSVPGAAPAPAGRAVRGAGYTRSPAGTPRESFGGGATSTSGGSSGGSAGSAAPISGGSSGGSTSGGGAAGGRSAKPRGSGGQ